MAVLAWTRNPKLKEGGRRTCRDGAKRQSDEPGDAEGRL